jgi:hypothetical protein
MPDDQSSSLRADGDTFVFRAFLVVLIVNLLIFPELPKEKREFNQSIGNELRRVKTQRALLEMDLNSIDRWLKPNSFLLSDDFRGKPKCKILQSDPTYHFKDDRIGFLTTKKYLQTALEKNAEQIVALQKAKYVRQLQIPGAEATVEESEIRIFYPTGLAVILLIIVLRYRNPFLRSLGSQENVLPAIWAAPLPYGRYELSWWQCTWRNSVWFGLLAITASLMVSALPYKELVSRIYLYVINALACLSILVVYLSLLVVELGRSRWRSTLGKRA